MPDVVLEGLTRTYPGRNPTLAVDGVTLTVSDGHILALLGPSGCGKTTTLRCIAGLENPDEGVIRIGDRTIFDSSKGLRVPTHRRDIGLVFQSYALWPHMSARRNIEFPLRAAKMPSRARGPRVDEVAAMVDLDPGMLEKRPGQLSGGQQQRVALARALVGHPSVLLFDEPLSNLDAHLRSQLRAQIHTLHERLGFTAVYVTHDLTEALALGDRIAVMSHGKVAQYGNPLDVFENPQDITTANLLGFRRLARIGRAATESATMSASDPSNAPELSLYARPERLRIGRGSEPLADGEVSISGFRVADVSYLGEVMETTLGRAGETIQARSQRGSATSLWWQGGDEVSLAVHTQDLLIFDERGAVVPADAVRGDLNLGQRAVRE